MGRVKDYNTFLRENQLQQHAAAREMGRLLDPKYESKAKARTEEDIKASFGEDSKGVTETFKFDPKKGGYVGKISMFSGEVILKEIDNEGDIYRIYEVTSGTNKGLSGDFTWENLDSGIKYPEFKPPSRKNWSDVLGPDEDFLKTFVSSRGRWATNISEIGGVKLIKVGLNGVYEIEYEDTFQFFGKVRIYYSGNDEDYFINSWYSYEVKDGPNRGTKGKGFQIFSAEENSAKSGVYDPFSSGDATLAVIKYSSEESKNNPQAELIARTSNGGTGINPNQLIFFNTPDLSSIKGPTKEIFKTLYGNIKDYQSEEGKNNLTVGKNNNILGRIEKSKLSSKEIYAWNPIQGGPVNTQIIDVKGSFPSLDGIETSDCYIAYYGGNPLILYTVKCQNKDAPSYDNKGVGTYGNNFFAGLLYNGNNYDQVRGEWYYDHSVNGVGIIYAYRVSDKKEVLNFRNLSQWNIVKIDFTDPGNPTHIVKDQTGGSWPEPYKPKDLKFKSLEDFLKED